MVFNPRVLEECLADATALRMLEKLALDCVNDNHKLNLAHDKYRVLEKPHQQAPLPEPDAADESLEEVMRRLDRDSAMQPEAMGLGAAAAAAGAGSAPAMADLTPAKLLAELNRQQAETDADTDAGRPAASTSPSTSSSSRSIGADTALRLPGSGAPAKNATVNRAAGGAAKPGATAKPLIAPMEPVQVATPDHTLSTSADGQSYILEVQLPDVSSVAEIDLDVLARRIELKVLDTYALSLDLPRPIDETAAGAKFIKAKSTLKLTLPFA